MSSSTLLLHHHSSVHLALCVAHSSFSLQESRAVSMVSPWASTGKPVCFHLSILRLKKVLAAIVKLLAWLQYHFDFSLHDMKNDRVALIIAYWIQIKWMRLKNPSLYKACGYCFVLTIRRFHYLYSKNFKGSKNWKVKRKNKRKLVSKGKA